MSIGGADELAGLVDIVPWDGPIDRTSERPWSRFDTSWSKTCGHLADELRHLAVERRPSGALALLELDLDGGRAALRQDGLPRASARMLSSGVRLTAQLKGEVAPMQLTADTYRGWQENVRALALSLDALRAVERWGVITGNAQYRGLLALPAPADAPTAERGEELVLRFGGYRGALRATHPDTRAEGMTDRDFESVELARGMDRRRIA